MLCSSLPLATSSRASAPAMEVPIPSGFRLALGLIVITIHGMLLAAWPLAISRASIDYPPQHGIMRTLVPRWAAGCPRVAPRRDSSPGGRYRITPLSVPRPYQQHCYTVTHPSAVVGRPSHPGSSIGYRGRCLGRWESHYTAFCRASPQSACRWLDGLPGCVLRIPRA